MNMEHDHVPAAAAAAAEVHPTVMQPEDQDLPEEMFIDGPPAWSQADMEQCSDMLLTYYDDDGTQFLNLSDLDDGLPEEMFMHVPHHSSPASDHVELPVAEMDRAMQPPQSVPPAPLTPPPPVQSKERKPWTEEEHQLFLDGLETYGRGDWRNISRNFVRSKTPSQIASHAQKYYLRQISEKKRKSIHDKVREKPHQPLLPRHTDHHTNHGEVVMIQESDQPLLPQLTDHDWVWPLLPQLTDHDWLWLLRTTGFF